MRVTLSADSTSVPYSSSSSCGKRRVSATRHCGNQRSAATHVCAAFRVVLRLVVMQRARQLGRQVQHQLARAVEGALEQLPPAQQAAQHLRDEQNDGVSNAAS
jgi:hypothetical protein